MQRSIYYNGQFVASFEDQKMLSVAKIQEIVGNKNPSIKDAVGTLSADGSRIDFNKKANTLG